MSKINVNTITNRVGNSGPTVDGNTVVSGILTATKFVGDGSDLTNLTLTGNGNLTNLTVSGVSTFTGDAEFNSDVTINGTLTYQDVTNIDSVGMVTARKGIQVLADGLTVVGVATFNDDVKLLDNDKATFGNGGDLEIYHSSTSSHIVDVGTGNFIIGSNGGSLKITKGDDTENMAVFTPDGAAALYYNNAKKLETSTTGVTVTGDVTATSFTGTASNASGATGDFSIADKIVHTGDTNTTIRFPAADTFAVETAGSERMRIDSSGRLLLGTTTEGNGDADDLTVASSGNTGITIRSGTTSQGGLFFSDATSGASEYDAFFAYDHNTQYMRIGTATNERLRIGSSGQLGLGGANYGTSGQVITSNGSGSAPTWQDAGGGAWTLISTISPSNSATAAFTSGIDSTYDTYVIIGSKIQPAGTNNFNQMLMRFSTDGGSSYISSSTYKTIEGNSTTTSATISGESRIKVGQNTTSIGTNTATSLGFKVFFTNLASSLYKTGYGESTSTFVNGGNNTVFYYSFGFANTTTSAINAIQFYFDSVNISDGEFRLYGINNS